MLSGLAQIAGIWLTIGVGFDSHKSVSGRIRGWLILAGINGCGKTCLAVAMAKDLIILFLSIIPSRQELHFIHFLYIGNMGI